MLTIDELAEALIPYLKEALGEDYRESEITVQKVTKAGDITWTGLMVKTPGEDGSPVIYIDPFYGNYQNGCTLRELAEILACRLSGWEMPSVNFGELQDFANVKDRIVFKLIDGRPGRNEEYLAGRPKRRLGNTDICIIYDIDQLSDREDAYLTVSVTDGLMRAWNETNGQYAQGLVTEELLYAHALANTPILRPPLLFNMDTMDVIKKQVGDPDMEMTPLYILTNQNMIQGAAALLYPDVKKELKKAFPLGYCLLPSSVHEWIVIDKGCMHAEAADLRDIVRKVNAEHVEPEELLGEDVFEIRNGRLQSVFIPDPDGARKTGTRLLSAAALS